MQPWEFVSQYVGINVVFWPFSASSVLHVAIFPLAILQFPFPIFIDINQCRFFINPFSVSPCLLFTDSVFIQCSFAGFTPYIYFDVEFLEFYMFLYLHFSILDSLSNLLGSIMFGRTK